MNDTLHDSTTDHRIQALVEVDEMSIAFPGEDAAHTVVDRLSFRVDPGETVGIVGESGSGKSLTALALVGLLPHNAQVQAKVLRFQGQDLRDLGYRQWQEVRGKRIGMIFQEPMSSLNPVLTIGRQLTEGLVWHERLSREQADRRALELLEHVRIPAAAKRLRQYPHELSGGMRQRVMIALALACNPSLLIADEPTTALDVTVQSQIIGLLERLRAELGMSILLITHDMGVVAETADRVVVMRAGEHMETGSVRELFAAPRTGYARELLAAVPRLGERKEDGGPASVAVRKAGIGSLLEVEDLCVRFDIREGMRRRVTRRVHAVEGVSFDIARGETLALVGESGSGKSTVARAILNLLKPNAGAVRLNGRDIAGLNTRLMQPFRRKAQMIFQDPYATLDPRMTVGRQVAEPLIVHGLARGAELRERTAALFEQVGLDPAWAKRYPHEFSGGQRQRICIARALAVEPELIVADEAVSALDVSVQARILELLQEIQARTGVSYLFISHDMAVVERISHRVAVMYLGRLVEIGACDAVLDNPTHPYTRSLIQAVPIPDPTHRPQRVQQVGDIPNPVHAADWRVPPWPMRRLDTDHLVALQHPADEAERA